jgi:DNA repair protein RadC
VVEAGPQPFTQVVKDPERFALSQAVAARIGPLDSDSQVARFLQPYLERQDQEVFVVLGLDIRNGMRSFTEVHRGVRDHTEVSVNDILRAANIEGCTGFIVAHNHPSGDPRPSDHDRELTKRLASAARFLEPDLVVIDHLILGNEGTYYSLLDKKTKRLK